jgi:hypothetical protein
MAAHAGEILIVTGVLTAGLGLGVVAPAWLLGILLGVEKADATTMLVARQLFLMGALVGALLVFAGYHPEARTPAMVFGAAEKFGFAGFVLTSPFRRRALTMFVVCADLVMAVLYVLILTEASK